MGTGRRGVFGEFVESLLIAVILALVIRFFIFQPFYIPSASIEPTLMTDDRIIVSKFNYYFNEPERGEVIVFTYPLDPSRNFVKRIVGLGGETVSIKDNQVYINGEPLPEEYLPPGTTNADYGPKEVPEGKLFMMGDNRAGSSDSRDWGLLDEELVIGKALAIYWPVNQISTVK